MNNTDLRQNSNAIGGSVQRLVRRLWVLRIHSVILLYKCKELAFGWYWKRQSTIVLATPLQLFSLHNNVSLWQLVNTLGTGKLRGWLSPELLPLQRRLQMYFRPISDEKLVWTAYMSAGFVTPNVKLSDRKTDDEKP